MENKVAHLEMIQRVITRMASNSFLIKRWSVTLVAALFALTAVNMNVLFTCLAFFPIFMFWALDAYFLRQDRLFRKLYDHVRLSDYGEFLRLNRDPNVRRIDTKRPGQLGLGLRDGERLFVDAGRVRLFCWRNRRIGLV